MLLTLTLYCTQLPTLTQLPQLAKVIHEFPVGVMPPKIAGILSLCCGVVFKLRSGEVEVVKFDLRLKFALYINKNNIK